MQETERHSAKEKAPLGHSTAFHWGLVKSSSKKVQQFCANEVYSVAWSTAKSNNPNGEGSTWKEEAQKIRVKFLSCIFLCLSVYVTFMSEYMPNSCQNKGQMHVRICAKFIPEYMSNLCTTTILFEQHLACLYLPRLFFPSESPSFMYLSEKEPLRWIYDNKYQDDAVAKKFLPG